MTDKGSPLKDDVHYYARATMVRAHNDDDDNNDDDDDNDDDTEAF